MSILDYFSGSASPEQRAGLTGLAAFFNNALGDGSRPVNLGAALSAGALGMQQGREAYVDRQQQQQAAQQMAALRALQVRSGTAELDAQQRALEQQAAIQQAARESMAGGSFDTNGFIGRVQGIDPLKAIQLQQQLAKAQPKFDSGITWVNGPDGKPVAVRTADDGSIKQIDGLAPRDKAELVNLGGTSVAVNPFDLKPGQSFQRTMTPDGAASNAIARANLGIAQQRLALDRESAGKPSFNAELGGFVLPPSQKNPQGAFMPLRGAPAGGKPPTEFQGKSAAFGLRATEADKILSGLEKEGVTNTGLIRGVAQGAAELTPFLGDKLGAITGATFNALPSWAGGLSEKQQQVEQARRDFVNAVLRQESGAAIGAQEFDNAAKQYFPQPGDTKTVIAQKARNRQLAIQGLQANAGKAALTAPVATGGWSITKVD